MRELVEALEVRQYGVVLVVGKDGSRLPRSTLLLRNIIGPS
jgi:hypothetical protein